MTRDQVPPELQYLVSDEIEQQVEKMLEAIDRKDNASRAAMANPLPGPLADVFAVCPSIQVGKFSVRPFYDIDFEVLQTLKHPLYDEMTASIEGRKQNTDGYIPRGQSAWTLFWIMAHKPEELDELIGGPAGLAVLATKARAEFGKLRLPALIELYKAVVRQIEVFSSAAVSFGPADGGAQVQTPFTQPVSMVTDGS